MFLLYADEADQDGSKEYLVFVAVFVPADQALKIHQRIGQIRATYGFESDTAFKFSPGGLPKGISRETHTAAKNDVLEMAVEANCKTCCYIVPHDIAKGQTPENRLKFAVNTLLLKFDEFLAESGGVGGIVKFDRTTDYKQDAYLKTIFSDGITLSPTRPPKKLKYIVSVDSTQIGNSHFTSLIDIIVGSFRFVINEPDKDRIGSKLLKSLAKIMWGAVDKRGTLRVRDRGFCVRPKNVNHPGYKANIEATIARLNEYGNK